MSHNLRSWFFAVAVLLLAEDFQYLLKINDFAFGPQSIEHVFSDAGENESSEGNGENGHQEGAFEKDDDDQYNACEPLFLTGSLLKSRFGDTAAPISRMSRDLESPPPKV